MSAAIAEIHQEATTRGVGKLSIKERSFIASIFQQSQEPGFCLSEKQANWLSAISGKLDATKGKSMWQVVAERGRIHRQRYHRAYLAACW